MKRFLLSFFLFFLITQNSFAQNEGFPLTLEPEVPEKNYGIYLFYTDSFTTYNNEFIGNEIRGEIKTHFLEKGEGFALELFLQHFGRYNPAILNRKVSFEDNSNINDISMLFGYKFSLIDQLRLLPYIKARTLLSQTNKQSDNLIGPELGFELEWIIYHETTKLKARYGVMFPLIHQFDGVDSVSSSSLFLNTVDVNLSYRLTNNLEVLVGSNLRQIPIFLGASGLETNELINWSLLNIGLGFVF